MPNPVEVVKRAAVEAVEAGKPVNILFGTVLSASPLKIQVDQKSIYTSKMLILTRNVTDFEVDMTVNHSTEDKGGGSGAAAYEAHKHAYVGKKTFKVHNALKAGEKVLLIRVQQGKKFVDIKQDFTIEPLPSRTFRMNHNNLTIIGTIDEIQAVEQAVFLILNTERYEWLIHSWDYGVELHNLIGKDVEYCIPEIERRVREALLQDDRITAVQNFEFTVNKKKVLTTFTVVSIFGEINAELGVEI